MLRLSMIRPFGWGLALSAEALACGGEHALPEPRHARSAAESAEAVKADVPDALDTDALDPTDVSMTAADYDATTTVPVPLARDLLDRSEVIVRFETLDVTLDPSVEVKLRTAAGLAERALRDADVRRRIADRGEYAQAYRLYPAGHVVKTNDEIVRALLDGNMGASQIALRLKLEAARSGTRDRTRISMP